MNIGFYSAKTGLLNMQTGIDVVSNNIANVSTSGYKEIRPSFSDAIYSAQNPDTSDAQVGHGVKLSKTDIINNPAPLLPTNRLLDFAIPKEGFFGVMTQDGDYEYTRNGAFHASVVNGEWTLVNVDGKQVLGKDGQPVKFDLDENGQMRTDNLIEKIAVYQFANPYGMNANSETTYLETETSGVATMNPNGEMIQCALEMSGVDIGQEMVDIMQYQRAFQLNSKMVQTSDEIQNIINNLR